MDRHPIGNGTCTPRIPSEVAALMAALQLKGGDTEALSKLKNKEWESLIRFCDPAHLTLALAQVEPNNFPLWVIERLKRNAADNALRFERVKDTYQEAAAALDRAEVEHMVIKGFTQAPEYVRDPRLRMQSDLDLYCPPRMIGRAKAALEFIGYRPEQTHDYSRADHLPSMIRPGNWEWRGNAFDPCMPLSIELHFCLWNDEVSHLSVPEVDNFWGHRIKRTLAGMSFSALSPIDHLGYMALHILRNVLSGDWIIHHVHELATFLHRHAADDDFWRAWAETHSNSLRALQAIAFYHAKVWFSCDVHPALQAEFATLPSIQREWLKYFAGSALEVMFQKSKDRIWLQASLIKTTRKRLALIWQTIAPPRSRLLPIDGPLVKIKNRQLREKSISNRYFHYLGYIITVTFSHARYVPILMWHGLILWWSQRQFRRQF